MVQDTRRSELKRVPDVADIIGRVEADLTRIEQGK